MSFPGENIFPVFENSLVEIVPTQRKSLEALNFLKLVFIIWKEKRHGPRFSRFFTPFWATTAQSSFLAIAGWYVSQSDSASNLVGVTEAKINRWRATNERTNERTINECKSRRTLNKNSASTEAARLWATTKKGAQQLKKSRRHKRGRNNSNALIMTFKKPARSEESDEKPCSKIINLHLLGRFFPLSQRATCSRRGKKRNKRGSTWKLFFRF